MRPVFGLGIPGEEALSLLPDELPAAMAFGEIPGEMLDSASHRAALRRIFPKQGRALIVRDIMPADLAGIVPAAPLRLKVEFDSGFRTRCAAAAKMGCRVVSAGFDIVRALTDASYEAGLVKMLHSIAGILEDFGTIMAFPLRLPAEAESVSAFLAFKHRLFYPGFRYLLEFHYEEPGAFEILENALGVLNFERSLWRLPYRPDDESRLTEDVLEKLRPVWRRGDDRPVFVCVDPGRGSFEREFPERFAAVIDRFSAREGE